MKLPMHLKQLAIATSIPMFLSGSLYLLAGCEREGPAERAGEEIDPSTEEARRAIDPADSAEQGGEELDRAAKEADR